MLYKRPFSFDIIRGLFSAPFMVSLILVVTLCVTTVFITPYWMTNDDVGMSMRAHGYGGFDIGTPNLLFSNVVWGYFLRSLPEIGGLLGYSLATYLLLVLNVGSTYFYLRKFKIWSFFAFPLVFGCYFLPFVSPQFTINAGLTALTATLALTYYARERCKTDLFVFVFFSFVSFIVRWNEFLLVALIALPLLVSTSLLKDRLFWLALVTLICLFAIAHTINQHAYNTPEWQRFNDFLPIRVQLTDYGLTERLRGTDEAHAMGLSNNDLDLLKGWFFLDSNLLHPDLKNFFSTSKSKSEIYLCSTGGLFTKSVLVPFNNNLSLWLAILVVLMGIIYPNLRYGIALAIFIASISYFECAGRSMPLRVYYPPLVLLFIYSIILAAPKEHASKGKSMVALLSLSLVVYGINSVLNYHALKSDQAKSFRLDFQSLSEGPYVAWGSLYPHELIYAPLDRSAHARNVNLFLLGSSSLAPTTKILISEQRHGEGFMDRFKSPQGIDFIGIYDETIKYPNSASFDIYCKERHGGKLVTRVVKKMSGMSVLNVSCL